MSESVVVIDYGAGNLRSVVRAITEAGVTPVVSSAARDIERAWAVVMPGVGSAAHTMANLRARGLVEPVREYIASGRPFLGVCMGLQALMTESEEGGEHPCLDVIPGRVVQLAPGMKVPHMGWNQVRQLRPHPVFEGIADEAYFYFVHSYYVAPVDIAVIVGATDYGVSIPAVVATGAVVATQFHPEKSGPTGLRFYRNFLDHARLPARV